MDTRLIERIMRRHGLYILFAVLIFSISVPCKDSCLYSLDHHESDESIVTASFFPTSSPFSNSQSISRLNRKKLSRKLEIVNMENYRQFYKKNESLIMMAKKTLSQPERHGILLFWQIGEEISFEKSMHQENASYIPFFTDHLSADLGMEPIRISRMEMIYTLYPAAASLSLELSFEHYEYLIEISDKSQRLYYQRLAVEKKWSPQDLKEKLGPLLYDKK